MKKYSDCKPRLVNRDILSTNDYEFMSKERIKEQCECINKNTCIRIVELFNSGKLEEGQTLLEGLQYVENL